MITATRREAVEGPRQQADFDAPFLEQYEAVAPREVRREAGTRPDTPFPSDVLVDGRVVSESSGLFRELLDELYDDELDEALLALADEANTRAGVLGERETDAGRFRAERGLRQWIEPLRMEAEALFESMAGALDGIDAQSVTDAELDELLDAFEPRDTTTEPVFDEFLKKAWKKAKQAAKSAVKVAKKGVAAIGKVLPVTVILNKIKGLVRPLLERVLKLALNRLPPALRPAAKQLAQRLLGIKEVEDEMLQASPPALSPASTDIRVLQEELDAEIATLLLARTELEQEALLSEASADAQRTYDVSLEELDDAREAFVHAFTQLEEGQDPSPLVENFVPAILPVLRTGISVIGRAKVVRFLANLLGRQIAPYVGPKLTPQLSQAIVDAGLRMMALESADEQLENPSRLAAEAFAGAVEDTVGALAEHDDLDDEEVLEEAARDAFGRAISAHFPPAVLRSNGDDEAAAGTWVGMPRHGPKRYRKYSRVFDVKIRPGAAAAVKTRAGRALATFLGDRLGKTGPVQARVHLYQAIPGTRLGGVARSEETVAGLGRSTSGVHHELHPLTREAAGLLLGDPELGQDVPQEYLGESGPTAVGQRFYYLEVAGGKPGAANGVAARRPRMSGATGAIDVERAQLRLAIYLSEAQAQAIAARVRRKEPIGAALSALRGVYAGALRALTSAAGLRSVRIQGETAHGATAAPDQLIPLLGSKVPSELIGDLLTRWTRYAISAELPRQREAFVTATSAPEDGVTLLVTLTQPPGLATVAQLLRGRFSAQALRSFGSLLKSEPREAKLEIVAGYRRA